MNSLCTLKVYGTWLFFVHPIMTLQTGNLIEHAQLQNESIQKSVIYRWKSFY